MASGKFTFGSPSPLRTSPPPSIRPTPLESGSSFSYSATSSLFQYSSEFSLPSSEPPPSPDLFDNFVYSPAMDSDFQRIDAEGEQHQMTLSQSSSLTPLQRKREQRTWVVFRGKTPGIYESLYVSSFCIKSVHALMQF